MKYILYHAFYIKGDETPRAACKVAIFDKPYEACKTARLLNTQTVEGELYDAKPLQTKSIKEFMKTILTLPINAL